MADKDLKITAGVEGAEDVGKAADKALSPWEKGAKSVGRELKSAFSGAITDMTRAVTLGNAISFAKAIESARSYRHELGILSSTAGPVAQLRQQIGAISQQKLIREQDLVAADRGLGRMVYSTKGALSALGALSDQAQATSETLADKLPLGATLMASMGVAGAKVGDELGRIRTLSDQLGTSGGLLAAEDRLTSMRDLLAEIGTATDADRGKLEAMALGIGNKGLSAGRGSAVAANIIGSLSGKRETFEALGGMKLGSLTDENGNFRVDRGIDAAQKAQAWVRRQSKDKFMQQMIASSLFGGDRQAGAAFLGVDFGKIRAAGSGAGASGKTAAEAAAYRNSDAGQAEARQQAMERTARSTAEGLLPVADRAQGLLAAHPFAGGAALGTAGNLAGAGLGSLLGKVGEAFAGGGRALLSGGQAGGAAVAAGGAAAGASLRAGAAGGALGGVGGLLGKLGLVGAAGAAGYAAGSYLDETFGISDSIEDDLSGGGAGNRKMADDLALSDQVKATRAKRRSKADKILALADKVKSDNPYISGEAEQVTRGEASGDAGLQRLAAATKTGTLDTTGLSPATVAMLTQAIADGFKNIKIENHSESPIAVNQQQAAGGLQNGP